MASVQSNGITIEYEVFGPEHGEPALLIMGLSWQLIDWPPSFVDGLAQRGFRVIVFDNRDVGLSSQIDARFDLHAFLGQWFMGLRPLPPYSLSDMARDAVGLLDALDVRKAHVIGLSMGGMIAQLLAADYPERTLSLCSIMSSSGAPGLPPPRPEAQAMLMSARPDPEDMQAMVASGVQARRVIGSPMYPGDANAMAAHVERTIRRSYHPNGIARQLAAITAGPDRRPKLATVKAPALVIHGSEDPLVPVEAGRDTAAHLPNGALLEIPGMGHDLPEALIPRILDAVAENAARARQPA